MPYRLPGGQQAAFGYRAVDLDGQPVSGLLIGNFTISLRVENTPGTGAYADSSETVSLLETTAIAGWYEFRFTPTVERRYVLTVTPTYENGPGASESYAVDFYAATITDPAAYATVSQVRAYLGKYDDQDTGDDSLIESLLVQATATIDGYAGRSFTLSAYTEYPRAEESSRLVLEHYPVQLSQVPTVHESADLPRVYDATTLLVDGEDYFLDTDTGILERTAGRWANGPRCVRVIYAAGFTAVPAEVNWCCIYLTALWLLGRRFVGVQGATGTDGSMTRFDHDRLPWVVKDILDRYRKVGIA